MNCRSAESLFSAFLEDDVNQKERRSFEAHLLACRRCSTGLRELRASLALVQSLPDVETGPHFEEDVMARIRSGEGLRPSTFEWLRGVLEPARLRPLALAGAGACAVWIAVLVVPRPDSSVTQKTAPIAQTSPAPATVTPPAGDRTAQTPTASGELAAVSAATPIQTPVTRVRDEVAARPRSEARSTTPNFASASADPEWSAPSSGQDSPLPNPGDRFIDEYITDQFYLERGLGGSGNPTIAPVSGRPSDDVYIIF